MGDFNSNWEDKSSRKNLKQIADNFDLIQLISGPTRITSSNRTQIDSIFSNRPERILKTFNMVTGLSDHNLSLVARKLTNKRFRPSVRDHESFRIPKHKQENFIYAVQQIDWDDLLLGIDNEEDSQKVSKKLESTIKDFNCKFRHKRTKNTVPWINEDILKLMNERDLVLKIAMKTELSHDRHHFAILRNKVVKKLRKAKADFFLTVIEKARGNSKIIWDQLNKLTGHHNKEKKLHELNINGKLTNNPAEVAEPFNHYFIDSVATIAQCFSPENTNVCPVNTMEPTFSIRNVPQSEIIRMIRSLKPSKTRYIWYGCSYAQRI